MWHIRKVISGHPISVNNMESASDHDIAVALEKLEDLLVHRQGSIHQMKMLLNEFEQSGLQKGGLLVNHPIQRYNGRTAVHLAADKGMDQCLELLLKSGGKLIPLSLIIQRYGVLFCLH